MNYTTADYLESLQEDLTAIKTHLAEGGMEISASDDFSSLATKTTGIQIGGGGSSYTGHYDSTGLAQIGWTSSDIQFYQENGVHWNAEDDNKFKLSTSELQGDETATTRFLPKNSNISYFYEYRRLLAIPVIDTSNKADMSYMFYNCNSLLNIPPLNTSSAWNLTGAFNSCYSITELDLSSWNVSNVTNMSNMFQYCYSLKKINLTGWDTSKVLNITSMFNSCYSLETLDLSGFNSIKINNMTSLCDSCRALKTINFGNFGQNGFGSGFKSLNSMFANCNSLQELDLSKWDTSMVTNMGSMFNNCYSLNKLDIRNFDFAKVTSSSGVFANIPVNCLIIVHDQTAKDWVLARRSDLTNVKTVTEYEAM